MIYNSDNLSFQIMSVYRADHEAGYFEVRRRPYAAISYKIAGTGEFDIMGKKLSTKANDILFLPANADYKVNYSFNDNIIIHLTNCNYETPECFRFQNSAFAQYSFLNILDNWNKNHSANQIKSLLYDIFFRLSQEKSTMINNPMFKEAVEYINENFSDSNLNISKLCRQYYLSESTLQRLFARHFDTSPKQYLLKLRLDKSFGMLTEGVFSVKEIASSCGFSDEKYFSRLFRKKTGYPPSQILKIQNT